MCDKIVTIDVDECIIELSDEECVVDPLNVDVVPQSTAPAEKPYSLNEINLIYSPSVRPLNLLSMMSSQESRVIESKVKLNTIKKKRAHRMKKQIADVTYSHFLKDFIPEMSSREINKAKQRCQPAYSCASMYNEIGEFRKETIKPRDFCDCLSVSCPGCFYDCPKCSSNKCSIVCRCNRRWCIEEVECEGTSDVYTNPILADIHG